MLEELFEFYVPKSKNIYSRISNCFRNLIVYPIFNNLRIIDGQINVILVRRLPPILWRKIRRELQDDFSEREADGSRVIVWAHKQVSIS